MGKQKLTHKKVVRGSTESRLTKKDDDSPREIFCVKSRIVRRQILESQPTNNDYSI